MGGVSRSFRRIFSHTRKRGVSSVPPILLSGEALPIQSASFRPQISTQGIHQSGGRCSGIPAKKRGKDACLLGRLAPSSQESRGTPKGNISGHSDGLLTGVPDQLGEVEFVPCSGDRVSRSQIRLGSRTSVPLSREGVGIEECHFGIDSWEQPNSKVNSESIGNDVFMHRCSTLGTSPNETSAVSSSECMEPRKVQPQNDCAHPPCPEIAASVVDRLLQGTERGENHCPQGRHDLGDGCLPGGVGSVDGGEMPVRGLDPGSDPKAYKLVRNEGSTIGTVKISQPGSESSHSSPDGQHNSGVIYKQGGGHPLRILEQSHSAVVTMVHKEQHLPKGKTHSRGQEHRPRCAVQERQDFPDRMDHSYRDSESDLSGPGQTPNRLVCNQSELQNNNVCIPRAGRTSLGGGCTVDPLERDVCIRFPSNSTNPEGATENSGGGLHSPSHCPMVAKTGLVPRNSGTADSNASGTAVEGGYNLTTSQSFPSQRPSDIIPNCLEIVKAGWVEKGIPEQSAQRAAEARRASTRSTYDARLRFFFEWCSKQNLDPLQTSVGELSLFFNYLFEEKKLKVSTISGYRAAISAVHPGWEGVSVGKHKLLSDMMRSFGVTRPPVRKLCPAWNLPLVLMKLCLPPFEPIEKADIKFLTWKTVFLLAAASARRRSTLHALSTAEGHIVWSGQGVNLIPAPGFLAKNESANYLSKSIFLPEMSGVSSVEEDRWLCPCRALRVYIDKTRKVRNSEKQLFLTYAQGRIKPASRDSISRWIVETIKWAYSNASMREKLQCRAHDVRGLSTSWALAKGVPLEAIMEAANWKSESTFTAFYMREVEGQRSLLARAVLSSARR